MRKDTDELIRLYNEGYSCESIGEMFGITRQSVWETLNRRGVVFRKKKLLPYIVYGGLKFTVSNTTGYYRCTKNRKKHLSLHRYKWEKERGPIPQGWDIHHKDEDKTNNDIENLECLPKAEHTSKYSPHHNQYKNHETIKNGTWKG